MIRHDLKRAFFSPAFWITALVYGVLLSLGATETWNRSAAYQFAFSYKTGFYILFYLCAVLPYGSSFLFDFQSGYWKFLSVRTSVARYTVSKVLVTALSAVAVVFIGSFVFVAILLIQYPVDNDFYIAYDGYDAIISDGYPFLYFVVKALLSGALGSMFSVIALYISTFLQNKIATISIPLILYYVTNELTVFGVIPFSLSPTVMMYQPPIRGTRLCFNVMYTLLYCILIIIIVGKLFGGRMRRLFEHG